VKTRYRVASRCITHRPRRASVVNFFAAAFVMCMMLCVKERMTIVQARVHASDASQLDADAEALGLANRSEAVRAALRLLHRQARHAALARDYDAFYGHEVEAPLGEVAAVGDQVAAPVLTGAPPAE